MLLGRDTELAELQTCVEQARLGRSSVVVLRGEAGIGKSALLDELAVANPDVRTVRAACVKSENAIPFAALHMLVHPLRAGIGGLPAPQANALHTVLGTAEAKNHNDGGRTAGDRFLVGLALLTLLSDAAEERPLLCVVDDAHWLDQSSAEALLFAARRLRAEPIALVFGVREGDAPEFPADDLAELTLSPLAADAAAELLDRRDAALTPEQRETLIADARGNPLALLELPASPDAEPSSRFLRLKNAFAERIRTLPAATQAALAVVAADDTSRTSVILAAISELGNSPSDLAPAEKADIVFVRDDRVEFRHPLLRAAAYYATPITTRTDSHRALASAHQALGDHCHYAWHLAAATTKPDDHVATVLADAAQPAGELHHNAATSQMLERAAELTIDTRQRAERFTLSAQSAASAGQFERAERLAEQAADYAQDPLQLADIALVRASVLDDQDQPKLAYRLLSDAAVTVAPLDGEFAGHLLFRAARSAASAGDLDVLARIAERAIDMHLPNFRAVTALASAFNSQHTFVSSASEDPLATLVNMLDGCGETTELLEIGWWQLLRGHFREAHDLAQMVESRARSDSAAGMLAAALPLLARTQLILGQLDDAQASAEEATTISRDIGARRHGLYVSNVLGHIAAIRGDVEACVRHTEEPLRRNIAPGNMHALGARSLLDLGSGRYENAFTTLQSMMSGAGRQGAIASLPDLIEAAMRLGDRASAVEALEWFDAWALRLNQPWAESAALRCRALTAPDDAAGDLFAQSVQLHAHPGPPFEYARTNLLYGEWLRRQRQTTEARVYLRQAAETFARMRAKPWEERANAELRAAGGRVEGQPGEDKTSALTPQERQVVRLAATGLSNRDIAAQLFLSPRTVGYHLYKAYPKLGVTSRGELATAPGVG
ncbi:helix-turn-helix transcriptional regulator [Hoyosella altamirensis]|uniref:DNA-binding CsgD family transcriptional regulator n=1 Tax=Hoyosella altamirensis TaxID=616997 RepID=A0A839RTS1_9ACTN|nr:AAA family ATPase [Hoyosella altamirensis]MBB3039293.1 DNA-binding CsgD family transcriptional regulator [Hoyosella altamirensis]